MDRFWIFFVVVDLPANIIAIGSNVALGKPTKQSSDYKHFSDYLTSDKATDGQTSGILYCAHTQINTANFWWAVDLEQEYMIQKIYIHGSGAAYRRYGYHIYVYKSGEATLNNMPRSADQLCFSAGESPQLLTLTCTTKRKARIVQIYKNYVPSSSADALTLCEVEIYTDERVVDKRKLDFCRQSDKDGLMSINNFNLKSGSRIDCANRCSAEDNCLGFKVDASGICYLYQTSGANSNAITVYYEKC